MTCFLKVITPGARTLVQDLGFIGGVNQGIPRCGVLDREELQLLNRLLGNEPGVAALEITLTSPRLQAEGGPVRIASGRGLTGYIIGQTAKRLLPEWTATTLHEGEELILDSPKNGAPTLLGVYGGPLLPKHMESQSTLTLAAFGGLDGRPLNGGDLIPVLSSSDIKFIPTKCLTPPKDEEGPIRVVLGPQLEWFPKETIDLFLSTDWEVTPESNRMGMRLQGPELSHDTKLGADIISDGIVPGSIQVPGAGKPILLLADAQTTGGYPKIATVISADISRVSRAMPGDKIRFKQITIVNAEAVMRCRSKVILNEKLHIEDVPETAEARMMRSNLISGAVDALTPTHFSGHLGLNNRRGSYEN